MSDLKHRTPDELREGFVIPDEVIYDLKYQLACTGDDVSCVDNYRAYRVRDGYGKSDYWQKLKSGCCARFDSTTVVNGDKWVIGCNYGH